MDLAFTVHSFHAIINRIFQQRLHHEFYRTAVQNFLLYGKINCKAVFITNFLDIHVILCVFDLIFNADDRFSAA